MRDVFLLFFLLGDRYYGIGYDDVAEGLAEEGGEECAPHVGTQDAECDADGRAEDGQEGEEAHP